MMRLALLAISLCLTVALALSVVTAQSHRFETFTSSTGLPNNAVYAIHQDRQGYLWFATDQGVCRFNGATYKNYSVSEGLADASARTLFDDREGNCWIVARGGVSRFNGREFTNFTTAHGLPNNEARSGLCARDGSVWVGTASGIARWDGTRFTQYGSAQDLPNTVWTMLEDPDGMLWLGLRGGGLVKFDGKAFKKVQGLNSKNIFDLTRDDTGRLWMATDNGLVRFDGKSFQYFTSANGLGNNNVSCVLTDRYKRVWCGTFGGGIARLEGDRFIVFNRDAGLPDNFVMSLLEDSEGNIWCGTRWSGVCRLVNEMFSIYGGEKSIGEGPVTGIAESPNGDVWFSIIDGGLARLTPEGRVLRYGIKDGLIEKSLWTLFADRRGRIWVGGQFGLSCFDGSRFENFPRRHIGNTERIVTIVEDREGRIWFGDDSGASPGVTAYDGRSFRLYSDKDGLPHKQVNALVMDGKGTLWACTENGLCSFNGERFVPFPHPIPGRHVQCAFEDAQRRLWIGTTEGLACFDGRTCRTYQKEDGLISNGIRAITGLNDLLWIGTSTGISAFDGQRFQNYSVSDGLFSNQVMRGARARTRDGSIWFGMDNGGLRCRPDKDVTQPMPPLVHVESVHVQGRLPSPILKQGNMTWPPVELSHDENSLTFDFIGISFKNAAAVEYSWYLEGFDPGWSRRDKERTVRFTNLPSGFYRFQVKACSARGLCSEPTAVAFTIRPAPWRTWWAYLFYGIAGVGVIYGGVQIRVHELRRRQKKLEAKIRERTLELERFRLLIRKSQSIVFLTDTSDNIIWVNDGFMQHTGYGPEKVFGKNPGTILTGPETDPAAVEKLHRAFEERTALETQIFNYRKDGTGYWVSMFASPVFDDEGEFQGFISIQIDITERKRLEGELVASQAEAVESARAAREASQAKSAFLANMSHELRTPLNAVLGFAQILQRDPSLGTEQRKHVSTILDGGRHLLGLINDVLSISKIEAGKTTLNESEFNLPALLKNIEDMLKLRARAKNLTLVFDPSPTLPTWVRGDEGKLRQILVNLLGNAVKFTERGSIVLRAAWDNDITEFEVEDTGPGIAEDEIGKLFEPFVQTAEGRKAAEGTGLGLAISRNFVRLMNGDIRVSSRLGKGTIFSFEVELPRVADRDMSPASERIVGLAPGQPRFRLLVADDKPENRAVLVNLLTPLGFDLREAHDGAEAVRLFAEWRPDLIWMDIRMPVLDGLEATRRIRELEAASDSGRPTVIVAVSASAFEHERDTCRVAGCTAFLPKPFQAEAIFEALTRHLGVRFTTDEDTPQATESESPVGPERFAALPEDWVAALHAAAQAGNRKAAGDAIEKIKARDAQLAGALADLLKNYRFDDIAELIEANGAHPNES